MQRIFSTLGQVFRKSIVILGTLSLSILSSLFIFVEQPSFAAPISPEGQKLMQRNTMDKEIETASQREEDYEQQVKAAKDPEKVYEDNLKEYKAANPGAIEGPLERTVEKTVEEAKELVDDVTGDK